MKKANIEGVHACMLQTIRNRIESGDIYKCLKVSSQSQLQLQIQIQKLDVNIEV